MRMPLRHVISHDSCSKPTHIITALTLSLSPCPLPQAGVTFGRIDDTLARTRQWQKRRQEWGVDDYDPYGFKSETDTGPDKSAQSDGDGVNIWRALWLISDQGVMSKPRIRSLRLIQNIAACGMQCIQTGLENAMQAAALDPRRSVWELLAKQKFYIEVFTGRILRQSPLFHPDRVRTETCSTRGRLQIAKIRDCLEKADLKHLPRPSSKLGVSDSSRHLSSLWTSQIDVGTIDKNGIKDLMDLTDHEPFVGESMSASEREQRQFLGRLLLAIDGKPSAKGEDTSSDPVEVYLSSVANKQGLTNLEIWKKVDTICNMNTGAVLHRNNLSLSKLTGMIEGTAQLAAAWSAMCALITRPEKFRKTFTQPHMSSRDVSQPFSVFKYMCDYTVATLAGILRDRHRLKEALFALPNSSGANLSVIQDAIDNPNWLYQRTYHWRTLQKNRRIQRRPNITAGMQLAKKSQKATYGLALLEQDDLA